MFVEHNFDLDTCGVSPKTLDLNSLSLCIPTLSSVRSHMVRWSQSHPVVGRSKVTPVFPPLVAISLYNTHFGNIRWTSNSLVTIRRLINVHFGVMGKKDMRDPWMHIIFFPPYASLMLGIHLSQNWLCRPGWGSRDSRRRISDLHSPSEKFLL